MRRLAAASLALLAACSTRPGYTSAVLGNDAPEVEDPEYRATLERFTRWQKSYDDLDTRVFMAATWESWPMRRARVAAEASMRALTPAQAAAVLAREISEARRFTDVFVGFYTADDTWNDLSSPQSIWHIEMENVPGGSVAPLAVERIARPDANLRALYPYLSPFSIAYRLRFPGPPDGARPASLVLHLASAVARIELRWDLAGIEAPPVDEGQPAPAPGAGEPAPSQPGEEPAPSPPPDAGPAP